MTSPFDLVVDTSCLTEADLKRLFVGYVELAQDDDVAAPVREFCRRYAHALRRQLRTRQGVLAALEWDLLDDGGEGAIVEPRRDVEGGS